MAEGRARAKESRIICQRTDLPLKQRRPVQEAVGLLFQNIVKKGEDDKRRSVQSRWGEFARALKASLDKSFEPHWHVLVGNQLGFACKKRDQTMGLWRIGETSVVIWKSPGIEGPPASPGASSSEAPVPEAAAVSADAGDAAAAAKPAGEGSDSGRPKGKEKPAAGTCKTAASAASLRVQEPSTVEAGSEVEQAVALLREELAVAVTDDVQELAQAMRRRLTSELGPIWHVVTGNEFVMEAAADRRNFVFAAAGKLRIVCFQHEQFLERSIDFRRIFKAMPYLLVVLFSFGYMTLNAVCQEQGPSPDKVLAWWIRNRFCHEGWEQDMAFVGGCALIGLFLSSKWKLLFPEMKN